VGSVRLRLETRIAAISPVLRVGAGHRIRLGVGDADPPLPDAEGGWIAVSAIRAHLCPWCMVP
jgi:hypothetical protein